ncbi:hypothetical protein IscW_ISCW009715 [Ixodes scapularis]|uniref:Gamma-butyrobetaine hydroxylase-like N-terminal domain-containing protein n=1 Tax=Ixodes scapularis TaxID=6945 RepID=B7PZA6_IXOSC|nr:hypothetical protein IscW_ISCW009715 [Ixodes scapularis]|eukprot:XP_002405069.1 hypothetical protein IscW_ISCW009715 [Ixodes scapularis]
MASARSLMSLARWAVGSSTPRIRQAGTTNLQLTRHFQQKRTAVAQARKQEASLSVSQAMPTSSHTVKVIFSDDQACELNYIWLRDNCTCPQCIHPQSKQKLVDTAALDFNVRPVSMEASADGTLEVSWGDSKGTHNSSYDPLW